MGMDPIDKTTPYQAGTKDLWVRLENEDGCFKIALLQLVVLDNPAVVMDAINRGAPLKEVKAGSDVEKTISDATDDLLKAVARSRGAVAA